MMSDVVKTPGPGIPMTKFDDVNYVLIALPENDVLKERLNEITFKSLNF